MEKVNQFASPIVVSLSLSPLPFVLFILNRWLKVSFFSTMFFRDSFALHRLLNSFEVIQKASDRYPLHHEHQRIIIKYYLNLKA